MGNSKSEILIIDDVPKNIQVISNILKKEGYEISFALNGEQGLKNVAFKAPDLILLDISMPGMDGFEFCKELKKEDKYNPKAKAKKGRTARGKYTLPKKGFMRYR